MRITSWGVEGSHFNGRQQTIRARKMGERGRVLDKLPFRTIENMYRSEADGVKLGREKSKGRG